MASSFEAVHKPVLVEQCLDLLAPAFQTDTTSSPLMVDATLGLGGHTEAALKRFPTLSVIGIDRDPSALALASDRLEHFGARFTPYLGTYDEIPEALGGRLADGILMDLGVSSMQLDQPERGFSYSKDAPLDMRMNQFEGRTAAELLNEEDEETLAAIIWRYSDERFSRKIAREIVKRREVAPLSTTGELADIVRDAIPAPARRTGGNPAKRTFQAIRIAVNEELSILEEALPRAFESLRVGGRIVIESYQSLEDRLVKRVLKEGEAPEFPPGLPITATQLQVGERLKPLTRKPILASDEEIEDNPRAASVRLRGAELIAPWRNNG